ncbi:hypothetical protein DFJ74DRAFT_774253 [Hyaloraphidium curvatum]|nr:hypothetical protein DFJ74DRAFT_774253 [Hyaloraphidium curvatum]
MSTESNASFAAMLALRAAEPAPGAGPGQAVFRATVPTKLVNPAGQVIGAVGLYLLQSAASTVARSRGFPHVVSLQVDNAAGLPTRGELDIVVNVLRTTRHLGFLRLRLSAAGDAAPFVLGQAVVGHLDPAGDAPPVSHHIGAPGPGAYGA